MRIHLLLTIKPDIICLNETHSLNETVHIDGFTCYQFDRENTKKNAYRGYGGVAILIRNQVLQTFSVVDIQRNIDGILLLNLKQNDTDYHLNIISTYLPPDNSNYGRDANAFFNNLLGILYSKTDQDVIMLGDLNAKLGSMIEENVSLCDRICIETKSNSHGQSFMEFLNDGQCVVLNGRFGNESGDYTCISCKGKSVVDYAYLPLDQFDKVIDVNIIDVMELCKVSNGMSLQNRYCKIPDHNIVSINYVIDHEINEMLQNTEKCKTKQRPRVVRKFPTNFLQNERICKILVDKIESLEKVEKCQTNLDQMYEDVISTLSEELAMLVKPRKKRKNTPHKPYWCEELSSKWSIMYKCHKKYRKCTNENRRVTLQKYRFLRKEFDICLKNKKRQYCNKVFNDLNQLNTRQPNKFWEYINNIGPRRTDKIDMIMELDGKMIYDTDLVLSNWFHKYSDLYFKEGFESPTRENNIEYEGKLSGEFTLDEIAKAVTSNKKGKGVGVDNISNELLKCEGAGFILCPLFNLCYRQGLVPSMWNKTNIVPIPKGMSSKPTDPLSYRGLSLQCCIYKTYSKLVNKRLNSYLETENILCESQNGFRPKRSTTEHVFCLIEILQICKESKQSTFCCFVDFKKAFDSVDRKLLLRKLCEMKLGSEFENFFVASNSTTKCNIKLPSHDTDFFANNAGVKQGDHNSPNFFNVYLNDLLISLNNSCHGVTVGNIKVNVLAYADDIVLICNSRKGLQQQLNILEGWCVENKIDINLSKTQVMCFWEHNNSNRTDIKFNGTKIMEVLKYKYLGIWVDNRLNFQTCAEMLSKSGSRALGSLIHKVKKFNDLGYKSYKKLFQSTILPVVDYGCEIWNLSNHKSIEDLQFRAIRYFMGVHKYTPLLGLEGDSGLDPTNVRVDLNILRFYNRLLCMSESRIPRMLYNLDVSTPWKRRLEKILNVIDVIKGNVVNIRHARKTLLQKYEDKWLINIQHKPKLRTYCSFKQSRSIPKHLNLNLSKHHRSIISQLRLGVLPLRVETGRFLNIKYCNRLCESCTTNTVEDEKHFLFDCPLYEYHRSILTSRLLECEIDFSYENLYQLMNNNLFIKFVYDIWKVRQDLLYISKPVYNKSNVGWVR